GAQQARRGAGEGGRGDEGPEGDARGGGGDDRPATEDGRHAEAAQGARVRPVERGARRGGALLARARARGVAAARQGGQGLDGGRGEGGGRDHRLAGVEARRVAVGVGAGDD